ncbi:MAG: hypothetical protein NDJ89_10240 [Oligoflexia bacterium]|nr:hypothetical protein [Oligoflexia bacterium]
MRITTGSVLSAFLIGMATWGPAAFAQDEGAATTAEAEEVTRGYLRNEAFGIKPQVGVLAFKDSTGDSTGRMAEGFSLEWNATRAFGMDQKVYLGPSTGLIFSHLGSATSNFVGTDPDRAVGNAGANLIIIPANLKVGYNISDRYRISAHGGGNMTYRSVANSMRLGATTSSGDADVWRMYPNVGGDVEIAFSRNALLLLRPDLTITPGDDFFTGTVGLGITLG